MKLFLGIDCSAYTTSCALVNEELEVVAAKRELLPVSPGARGLKQSEAVFLHIRQLPDLLRDLMSSAPDGEITAICASDKPLPRPESYMPVFQAGKSAAASAAALLRVPCYFTTHQQGHLEAAGIGISGLGSRFLGLHLSGGTTEMLLSDERGLTLVGGSRDLHAGQLVDRIGVALGLPFPAGPHLEELAVRGKSTSTYPAITGGAFCHFSGAETQMLGDISRGLLSPQDAAAEVYDLLARTTLKMLEHASRAQGATQALLFGGVASSTLLRRLLRERLAKRKSHIELFFGDPALSGDNAAGVALIGAKRYLQHT